MCGIAGIYSQAGSPANPRVVAAMIRAQAHRGPDGQGAVFIDPTGKEDPISSRGIEATGRSQPSSRHSLALGHCRLAILDLTPLGHQPMSSEDGCCWVTYNGEIYNYLELRDALRAKGHRFCSNTDTEVLLAAYREWGEDCLARLNGMFAFALWDVEQRRLFCARDRFGEKPFYYSWDGERFAFASEIKGLLPAFGKPSPNHLAVFEYLEGAVHDDSDHTFFDGIQQLPPAQALVLEQGGLRRQPFWSLPERPEEGEMSLRQAGERFGDLFRDAVRIRLRSDVEVGSCLSGGLDSSSIVCIASDLRGAGSPLRTFSSCFEDPAFDERAYAHAVVARSGADAQYVFPHPAELERRIMDLVWQQDEPFGSTSIFAQWSVMRTASQHGVKVLLDGQGGDELLAGYPSLAGAWFADLLVEGKAAALLREGMAYRRVQGSLSRYALAQMTRALLPARWARLLRRRLTGTAAWLASEFRHTYEPVSQPRSSTAPHLRSLQKALLTGNGLRALLHYEDRNSMAFGVETRLPFLDHRLAEFLYGLAPTLKIDRGWTKVVLREAMQGILPEPVRCRADKMGFVTPEDQWLRTTLQGLVRDVLSDPRTRGRGYLNVGAALQVFDDHVGGRKNIGRAIWRWLNLELWCRRYMDEDPCVGFVS